MKITTTNSSAASSAAAMAAAGDSTAVKTESTTAANLKAKQMALWIVLFNMFHIGNDNINSIINAINATLEAKTNSINTLKARLEKLDQWNTPPGELKVPADPKDPLYKDRTDKTDELLLNGVSIPDDAYDAVKYTYDEPGKTTPSVGYASLPIQDFSDAKKNGLVDGQLYSMQTSGSSNEKTYYRYSAKTDTIDPVSSPIAAKTKPHDDDFSKFEPGDLVQDDETKQYYRVTNDHDGVEVTGYPLQKFIYTASDDAISKLKTAITNRLTSLDTLTKKDTLGAQDTLGNRLTLVQKVSNMFSALADVANAIVRNMS